MNHTVSSKFYLCFAVLMAMPVLLAADNAGAGAGQAGMSTATSADEHHMGENKHFDSRITTWAEGTVSSIDYDHNTFMVHGKKMPFATAHAEMRKEFRDRMKNADASQREKIAGDVRQEWRNRLEDARKQAANEPEKDFSLKFAADGKVKESSDFPIMSFLNQRREMMEKMGEKGTATSAQGKQPELVGEFVIVEVYEMPQNVSYDKEQSAAKSADVSADHEQNESAEEEAAEQKAGGEVHAKSNLTFRDVKAGDKVMCGFDSTNNCYLIIRESKTGMPTSTTTPSR